LKNGSFEDAVVSSSDMGVIQPGWNNEDQTSNGKIATYKTGAYYSVPSVTGKQFIELNYQQLGTITQNVVVAQGVPLNITYYHKAKGSKYAEKVRLDIKDLITGKIIHTYSSSAGATAGSGWIKNKTVFRPTSNNIQVRIISLNSSNGGTSDPANGNFIDAVTMNYASCECTYVADPPTICATTDNLCTNGSTTITATGCVGGTIKWSNGQTGPVLTTNVPGVYTAQCVMPGMCESVRLRKKQPFIQFAPAIW
jgi:hypothetical protein